MRSEIETTIRGDAAADATFRTALISDPAAAITERYGVALPGDLQFRVVEEAADEVVLVLPADHSERQFSDTDLDIVNGASYTGYYSCPPVNG